MKLRKTIALVLAAVMLICVFAGCGGTTPANNTPANNTPANDTPANNSSNDAPVESKHYPVTIDTFNYAKEPIKVTFEKNIYEEFPAGTNVRLHKGSGFYKTIENAFPQKEWKQIGGTIELPANAKYFFPCVIYYGPKEQKVQLRNLRLIIE